ncbi:MAG: efflux RND transporter periplasmic adaptor subunit [Verrucomicrobiota bacterium]|jgi:RND family efflux transporter MFP subunit|nr:efflux RND transporter periplasmic adaptor subunit [Verrucomicrobiota bacterium]
MKKWIAHGGGMMAAAVVAVMVSGCGSKSQEGERELLPVAIRTAVAEPSAISAVLHFTGELESPLSVEVTSKTQGRLIKLELKNGIPVTEGIEVEKGAVLAEIEHEELEAQVSLAGAQLQQAEVTLADRDRERRRIEALFDEEVSTEQARDAAVTAHESAKAALAQAQAQLKLARVNLNEAFIRAPMDGVVAERYADPGAVVGSSTPILRLVQMMPLRLRISVPARLLPALVPGETAVAVRTDVYEGRVFPSQVDRIFPTVDPLTRTARIEVLLNNEQGEDGKWLLRPGMYATAEISLAAREAALTIPASSVLRVLDRQIVFVVDGDTANVVDVRTGIRSGDQVEILEGLDAGDEYVVMGQNKLTDGVKIERVEELVGED